MRISAGGPAGIHHDFDEVVHPCRVGIGDKHIPWVHNVKNTDAVVAMDDEIPMNMIRLFNEPEGKKLLKPAAEIVVKNW